MSEQRRILLLAVKEDAAVLRQKTADVDFARFTKKELKELVRSMRAMMKAAEGVGLAANQIGLNLNMFVARHEGKFYAVFNPRLTRASKDGEDGEEGCLSVPEKAGLVSRARTVLVEARNVDGKPIKIKAWGFLARIFQHEIDHLHGKLFVDKAKEIYAIKN